MAIDQEKRTQLANALRTMRERGDPLEKQQQLVNAFKSKYGGTAESISPGEETRQYGLENIPLPSLEESKRIKEQYGKSTKQKKKEEAYGKARAAFGGELPSYMYPEDSLIGGGIKGVGPREMFRGVSEKVAYNPALRGFTEGATAGLSKPISAGLSSLALSALGDQRSLGDIYGDVSRGQTEKLKQIAAESPGLHLLGTILGIAAPGGVFSLLGKGAKGVTQLPNISAEAMPMTLRMLQGAAREGMAGLGYGTTQLASQKAVGEEGGTSPLLEGGLGALFGAISPLLGVTAKGISSSIKEGVLPARVQGAIESIPGLGGIFKGARETKEGIAKRTFEKSKDLFKREEELRRLTSEAAYAEEKRAAVEGFKDLIEKDPAMAASGLAKKVKSAEISLGKKYDEMVNPIIKKYSSQPVETEPFINVIDDSLRKFKIIDETGAIRPQVESFLSLDPEMKSIVDQLMTVKNSLTKGNFDIASLDSANSLLQTAAKFSKETGRSGNQKVLGSLSRDFKNTFDETLASIADPEEIKKIREAKKLYAEQKPIFKELEKLVGKKTGSQLERLAVNLRSRLPASTMKDIQKVVPGAETEMADLFLNMLTQHSVSPRKFTKEIEYYGRPFLEKLMGAERFKGLTEAEKRLQEAAIPFGKKFIPGMPPTMPEEPISPLYEIMAKFLESPERGKSLRYIAPTAGSYKRNK